MLVASELVYRFTVRRFTASAFTRDIFKGNPVALWMSALLIVLQLAFTYAPPMQRLFQTAALDGRSWLAIAGLSALLFGALEAGKAVLRRRGAVAKLPPIPSEASLLQRPPP
jgi:magnesium-transporting ATPase (P-type)